MMEQIKPMDIEKRSFAILQNCWEIGCWTRKMSWLSKE